MMEHGLLPYDEARKAFERKQKKVQTSKHGCTSKSKEGGSSSKGKRKKESSESDSDDDFLAKIAIKKKLKS